MSLQEENLNDINTLYNNNILQTSALTYLNDRVINMNVSLKNMDTVQKNGLSKQSEINDIITTEADRLDQKKNTIDQAVLSQNRILYFNDNNRKRYAAYLRILMVAVITLATIWALLLVRKHIDFIPDWFIEIIIILTVTIGLIIIYNYYIDIRRRNLYNFDEINLEPPAINIKDESNGAGNLSDGAANLCIGAECCKPATKDIAGSTWDEILGKCLNDPKSESFTNLSTVKPREAFEYTDYSPYK